MDYFLKERITINRNELLMRLEKIRIQLEELEKKIFERSNLPLNEQDEKIEKKLNQRILFSA